MLKRVDEVSEPVEGYSYINDRGQEESVQFNREGNHRTIKILVSAAEGGFEQDKIVVWKSDIPKLIKALQSIHDHGED